MISESKRTCIIYLDIPSMQWCRNLLCIYKQHRGLGIDLRKRKIWDTFGPDINLQEKAITPSGEHLFPDYDWIIGNHSDELTPWIPVIAARTSYKCCFFLLPCCHHDFVGKYSSIERGKSHYASYLDYVKEIIYNCGFHPECDTLRIPSTKRICYVGRHRSYEQKHEAQVDQNRQAYIDKRTAFIMAAQSKNKKRTPPHVGNTFLRSLSSPLGSLSQQAFSTSSASDDSSSSSVVNESEIHERGEEGTMEVAVLTQGIARDDSQMDSSRLGACNSQASHTSLGRYKRKSSHFVHVSIVDPCSNELHAFCEVSKKKVKQDMECDSLVGNTVSSPGRDAEMHQWAANFKPRVEENVRNCQQVRQETKTKIVSAVFQKVLVADESTTAQLENGKCWRKGGAIPLGEVADLFDKLTLQELKAECGGLQTLLRNHSHIFQVTGGVVCLRDFTLADPWQGRKPKKPKAKERNVKTTLCWFHEHHPDGCPRPSDVCLFAHGDGELRQRK